MLSVSADESRHAGSLCLARKGIGPATVALVEAIINAKPRLRLDRLDPEDLARQGVRAREPAPETPA
jgi:hypothetical protein